LVKLVGIHYSMNPSDETLSIDTPENVIFGYRVAGIGSRFLAALVDTTLIVVLQLVVNLAVLLVARYVFGFSLEGDQTGLAWLLAIFGLIAFAFLWGYYIFFEMLWNGQSPGKRWVGLRVMRMDGTPITLSESIIRNLVRLVDFLPAYYGVGVVAMFISSQARRLGDLAAGTVVVHDRAAVTLESLAAQPARPNAGLRTGAGAGQWPVERLTSRDLEMAEDFLRRRDTLANRSDLARRIAQTLLTRMGADPALAEHVPGEVLIEEILAKRT
jgi:uncharacterized RDD family membrane protein YckC